MKNNFKLIVILSAFFFVLNLLNAQSLLQKAEQQKNPSFEEIRTASEELWKDIPQEQRKGWKQFKRWEHFWESRLNTDGTFPSGSDLVKAFNSIQKKDSKKSASILGSAPVWKSLGPTTTPVNPGSPDIGIGRVNIIRINPRNPKHLWLGSAGGGVWRSTDGGKNWETFAYTQFLSLGVSDIAISPTNPNTVYVATGDADGIGGGGGNSYSVGIIKTTDDGDTWTATNLNYNFSSQRLVCKLIVNPNNENIVIATTSDGIYKTTDGGNSWERKSDAMYFKDLEMNTADPNILFATTYGWSVTPGIYKSADMGDSWKQVLSVPGSLRIDLAVTMANSDKVYALCAAQNSAFHSFRMSTNNGNSWTTTYELAKGVNILGRDDGTGNDKTVGQGWYDLAIAASPVDENEVTIGGINLWKTYNSGSSWSMITHWYAGYGKPFVHADQHDLVYDENQGFIYAANDGGLDRSTDGGNKWVTLNNGINITQYYKIATSAKDPNVIYGGAQDNGSHRYNNGSWSKVYGGDGMNCEVDYVEPLYAYISLYNGALYRTTNGVTFYDMLNSNKTGESGAWVTPFIISPSNHEVLYAGYKNVWKSTDAGKTWSRLASLNNNTTLKSMAAGNADSVDYIYAATGTTIWASYNGGNSWTKLLDAPESVSSLAVDPKNPKRLYVTNDGFNDHNKVFVYDGSTKKNISGNLPNFPVNSICYQKDSPDRLYIGTDIGVYMSDYNSSHWELYGEGLPNLIVNEVEIQYSSQKLRIATYGRGVWETSLNNCNVTPPQVNVKGLTSFCSGDSVIIEAAKDYTNYKWSTGETTKKITVKTSGSYSLGIEDANGCKAYSPSVDVDVKPSGTVVIKPIGKFPVCEGETMNLELNVPMGFIKYQWSTGDTSRRIKVTKPGTYSITVTNSDTCTASSSFDITLLPQAQKPEVIRYWYNLLKSSLTGTAYQWYFKGKAITGATSDVLKIDSLGDYTVMVTDKSGCTNVSDPYNVVSEVNDNQQSSEISVYPNPSNGLFKITINAQYPDNYRISVKNTLGLSVFETISYINGNWKNDIDLNNLPAGMFDLIISNSADTRVFKLIKY